MVFSTPLAVCTKASALETGTTMMHKRALRRQTRAGMEQANFADPPAATDLP